MTGFLPTSIHCQAAQLPLRRLTAARVHKAKDLLRLIRTNTLAKMGKMFLLTPTPTLEVIKLGRWPVFSSCHEQLSDLTSPKSIHCFFWRPFGIFSAPKLHKTPFAAHCKSSYSSSPLPQRIKGFFSHTAESVSRTLQLRGYFSSGRLSQQQTTHVPWCVRTCRMTELTEPQVQAAVTCRKAISFHSAGGLQKRKGCLIKIFIKDFQLLPWFWRCDLSHHTRWDH